MRNKRRRRLRARRRHRALRERTWQRVLARAGHPHEFTYYEDGPILGHIDYGITFYVNRHTGEP